MSKLLSLLAILAVTSFAQLDNPKNQSGTLPAQKPELVVQTRHSSGVLSVAFSPDGKTLASGSKDNTVRLWDVSTGTELRTLKKHSKSVLSVAFSPDGKTLASGSEDHTVKLWDILTGSELHTLEDVGGEDVYSVTFSPDRKTLASTGGSLGRKVYLWEVSTGTYLSELEVEESSRIDSVAFSPDGKTLATSAEGGVKLWDLSSGTVLRTLEGNYLALGEVAFSPDGKTLAASARDGVKLWDVSSGTELRTLVGQYDQDFASVAFSPDGKTVASGGWNKTIKLWDVSTGTELRTLKGAVNSVTFSPDGKTLASGSNDNTIRLWDVSSGTELRTLKGNSEPVGSIAFSPDGKTLASGSFDSTVKLWDVSTGPVLRTVKGSHFSGVVTFSPDGKTLAASAKDGVTLLDVSSGTELRTLVGQHDFGFDSVAFSPDGKTLASCSDDKVKLWDVLSGSELRTLKGSSGVVRSVAFSPDGKTLAGGITEISMKEQKELWKLWDVSTGAELRTVKGWGHENQTTAVAFSADGRTLASANSEFLSDHSSDYTVKLWDVSSGEELRALKGHSDVVESVAFSPDGKFFASGSMDCTVKVWNVPANKLRTLKGHSFGVVSLAFSQSNQYLVSGSWDGTVKIWEVSSGRELASLIAFDENDWIVVTPDGLFDGSPAAWNKIIWRFNNNTFSYAPVEAFFSDFYYPGLLTDIFAGKRPKAPSDISQKDRRQPQLKLTLNSGQSVAASTARNVTVKIDVSQAPAGAQDVRLFRNGSLVKVWRGDVLQGKSSVMLETTIPIVAGENRLTAYAFNHDNIKSNDVSLAVNGPESLKRQGTAYILAVGINNYSNSQYNLKYAVADAEDFSAEVKRQQELLKRYAQVEVTSLSDTAATKANITKGLSQLAARVQPEDGVIIYFAGHGTAHGNQFYLIPHDLGYDGPREKLNEAGLQTILEHSISDRELEKLFEGIDAGQLLLVIDACNSGQALEAEEKRRGPMNSKGLAQLAYEKGMYVLTAAQSYQAAQEAARFGHGFLTYALMEEGLKKGAADYEPKDGRVTLNEWLNYAADRVPKMQQENMLDALRGRGRDIPFATGEENVKDPGKRSVQRPRIFYRREVDSNPLVVAVLGATRPQ